MTRDQALSRAIERFRADPEMARFDTAEAIGGCKETAVRFAWHCADLNITYRFRKWRVHAELGLLFTDHVAVEVHGEVIDWTLRQFDSSVTTWPARSLVPAYGWLGAPMPVCPRCGVGDHAPAECLGQSRNLWEHAGKLLALAFPELASADDDSK